MRTSSGKTASCPWRAYGLFLPCLFLLILLPCFPAHAEVYVDNLGREVRMEKPPQRIVALIPSLTEIVYALGLGDRMVGATRWADYPEAAKKLPRVGAYLSPSVESILSLAPDLVLVEKAGNPPWVVEQLEKAQIPVFVTWIQDPKQVPENLKTIGALCGAPEKGRELSRAMAEKFASVERKVRGKPQVPVFFIIGNQPVVSVGKNTFPGRLLAMAGGKNLAAKARGAWPRLSFDYILESRPKVIIVSTMERGSEKESLERFWKEKPGIMALPDLSVRSVASDMVDRPGPRLGEGLERLAKLLHPGLF